jgi:methionine-rich copper-binding protein CopC
MRSIRAFTGGLVLLLASHADAHAILVQSSPAAHSTVTGQCVPLSFRFNSRVDALRSRLVLVVGSDSGQTLKINETSPTDTLTATARDLKPGNYRVRWQVLAVDGHVTRGELEFEVKP